MKTPFIVVALAVVALTLAPASNPRQAGTPTYDFVEGTGAPHPGETGATITFFSPPASATSPWSTTNALDIEGIAINDAGLFPDGFTGPFMPQAGTLRPPVFSDGPSLDFGVITNDTSNLSIEILSNTTTTFLVGTSPEPPSTNDVAGTWTVSATVPEPASAVQAGIASAIGLALAAFRKRKEARRQWPVGPLDANQ